MLSDLSISKESWDFMNGDPDRMYEEWVLGISVAGHGGSICLLHDGNIVFFLKEERTTGIKRDCVAPFKSLNEINKYTDELDLVVFLNVNGNYEELFISQLRKQKIKVNRYLSPEWVVEDQGESNQDIYDDALLSFHHINHASCGYHLSPFSVDEDDEETLIVVMDGWGYVGGVNELFKDCDKFKDGTIRAYDSEAGELRYGVRIYEHVSIFSATPIVDQWNLLYKEVASDFTRNLNLEGFYSDIKFVEDDYKTLYETNDRTANAEIHLAPTCSTPVLYESVTQLIGFHQEDVGKTMGMAPYGKPNEEIPPFAVKNEYLDTSDVLSNNLLMNTVKYPELIDYDLESDFQHRADIAYAVQKTLEEKVINVVEKAMSLSDSKKVVLSGGVFHNIIINEMLASKYPDYTFFADPICDDAGHSYGGAMFYWKSTGFKGNFVDTDISNPIPPDTMYLGPEYSPEEQLKRIKNWFKKSTNK